MSTRWAPSRFRRQGGLEQRKGSQRIRGLLPRGKWRDVARAVDPLVMTSAGVAVHGVAHRCSYAERMGRVPVGWIREKSGANTLGVEFFGGGEHTWACSADHVARVRTGDCRAPISIGSLRAAVATREPVIRVVPAAHEHRRTKARI